jgi:hypothetical protein
MEDEAPDFDHAFVDREKIVDYLLTTLDDVGIAKARFFGSIGFSTAKWDALALALRQHAALSTLRRQISPWGTKIVATGLIDAPNGRRYKIVSVWIETGDGPRFVAAYPMKGSPK